MNIMLYLASRSKEVDWQPYFTTRLVDDFATHLRVFRKAQDRLADREDKQSMSSYSHVQSAPLTVYVSCVSRLYSVCHMNVSC